MVSVINVLITWLTAYGKAAPPCLFHLLTGWYCPGCGGTRALYLLLTGHPLLSFVYHPLVLYVLLGLAVLLCLRLVTRRRSIHRFSLFLWGGLGVLLINFMVKNIALLAFGVDLLQ
jgi:uncharacterized membrane protein YozB (DUF420 family)